MQWTLFFIAQDKIGLIIVLMAFLHSLFSREFHIVKQCRESSPWFCSLIGVAVLEVVQITIISMCWIAWTYGVMLGLVVMI